MSRTAAAVLLVLYSFVVLRLTLADPSASSWAFSVVDRVATEELANVALFVPAGFLLAVVVRSAWLSAVLCVLGSVLIEYVQLRYLPLRVPSGADVLHNGYGAALGAALALPFLLGRARPASNLT